MTDSKLKPYDPRTDHNRPGFAEKLISNGIFISGPGERMAIVYRTRDIEPTIRILAGSTWDHEDFTATDLNGLTND